MTHSTSVRLAPMLSVRRGSQAIASYKAFGANIRDERDDTPAELALLTTDRIETARTFCTHVNADWLGMLAIGRVTAPRIIEPATVIAC